MAATGELKERIQLLQAAVARGKATGKALKPELQAELDSYAAQGLLGSSAAGSAGGKVTEGERKTAFLATRLAGSLAQIAAVPEGSEKPSILPALFGGTDTTIGNLLTGADRQRIENAQTDLLDSALTLGTGAAYTKEQLDGYRKAYFPQIGDSASTIADKRKRLDLALEAAKIGAGGAASQIDEALKKVGYGSPGEQAKGGDQTSGTAGAVGGSSAPPAGPASGAPSTVDTSANVLVRGDQAPQLAATGQGDYTPEQRDAIAAITRTGTPEQLRAVIRGFGRRIDASDEDLRKILAFYQDPKNANVPVRLPAPDDTLKAVDPGEGFLGKGKLGAAAQGVANAATLGFFDEGAALVDTVARGGTYAENLDRRRGQELYDEENNGGSRIVGQIVGSLPLGGVEFASGRAASLAAGRSARLAGASEAEASSIANRVLAGRTAIEAAGIGGIYGFGDANGGIGDRIASGALSAGTSALGGYGLTRALPAAGRFARTMAARRGAATPAESYVDLAARLQIQPTPATVGGGTSQVVQMGLGNLPGGMSAISKAAEQETAQLGAAARRTAESLGPVTTRQEAGASIARGARAYERATSSRGGALYRERDNLIGGAQTALPLDATRSQFARFSAAFPSSPALAALREHPVIRSLENALPDEGPITLGEATEALSHIRGVQRNLAKSNTATGAVSKRVGELEQAIEDDVMAAAQRADEAVGRPPGPGSAVQAQRDADAYWRDRSTALNGALKKPLKSYRDDTDVGGEAVFNGITADMQRRGGNLQRLRSTWFRLPTNARSTFAATQIDDMGRALAGQQNDLGTNWSFNTFLTNYDNMSPQARKVVFGKEGDAQLADIARYADRLRTIDKSRNFSNTAKNTIAGALLTVLGTSFWRGDVSGLALSVGAVPAAYGAAKTFLGSPAMREWTKKALKIVGSAAVGRQADETAAAALVRQLPRIARAEPAIANDILGLHRQLSDALPSLGARAAAEERPDKRAAVQGEARNGATANQRLQP